MYNDKIGDKLMLAATGVFAPGVLCEVVSVDEEGRANKLKAVVPDERLGRVGFLKEGDDYVVGDWRWSPN